MNNAKPTFVTDHRPCACDRKRGNATAVQIGDYTIWAGGGTHLPSNEIMGFDRMIDLRAEKLTGDIGMGEVRGVTTYVPIADFRTVTEDEYGAWVKALLATCGLMKKDQRIVVFCAGGHGRTGLFLASLLALVEPKIDDPVEEIRHRYCPHAVETDDQYAQVMRVLNETRRALATTS